MPNDLVERIERELSGPPGSADNRRKLLSDALTVIHMQSLLLDQAKDALARLSLPATEERAREALRGAWADLSMTYEAAKSGKPLEISLGQWRRLASFRSVLDQSPTAPEPTVSRTEIVPNQGVRDELVEARAEIAELKARGAEAIIAYHVAICSPKGVVPNDSLYDPVIADKVTRDMEARRSALSRVGGEG